MFLKKVRYLREEVPATEIYPFNIPALQTFEELEIPSNVTFFVGENGSGKSTLLEAIADISGFHTAGGNRNHLYDVHSAQSDLAEYIKLSWSLKVTKGFFLRAETFYQFASHLDLMENAPGKYDAYGGKSLHKQSHGEAFLSLFKNAFGQRSIFLLDEPEAALSPTRQLSLMRIIKELEEDAQFIIATHSPILLGYPDATIYQFDEGAIEQIRYEDTMHYIVTKRFLDAKERVFEELFRDFEDSTK